MRQLDKHATGAEGADVVKWFTFAVFDVIGDLAFGAPFGGLESGKTHFWVKRVCDGANGGAFRGALVKLFGSTGVGGWLATWFTPRKERDARTSNYDFCREQVVKWVHSRPPMSSCANVRRRMDSKTPRRDFFTPILNGPEGPTMGLETLVAQSFAFAYVSPVSCLDTSSLIPHSINVFPHLSYHSLTSTARPAQKLPPASSASPLTTSRATP